MCCRALFKYTLFTINLLFTLVGIALIVLGVIIHFNWDTIWVIDDPSFLDIAPYAVIALGVIVFLIAFFGCCGSVAEIKCFLIFYAVLMAILAAFKIFAVVMLYMHMSEINETVEVTLEDAFENIETDRYFHGLEVLLKCCGTTGPDSYNATHSGLNTSITIDSSFDVSDLLQQGYLPPTCCENPTEETWCLKVDAFQDGCMTLILDKLQDITRILGLTLISFAVYEVVAMLTAIYISCTKRSPKKLRYY